MNENRTCENCGCCNEELFELEINGETRFVCADCAEANGYRRCDDCGEWVPEADTYTTHDGDIICESCYDDGYFTCEDCGEIFPNDECIVINDNMSRYAPRYYVCQSCADDNYIHCDDCGDYVTENYCHSDEYTTICDACYDAHYYTCENCGHLVHSDDVYFRDGYSYCEDCYDSLTEGDSNFHDYGYKPTPEFCYRNGERHDVDTFGVELEVDCGDDHNALCNDLAEIGMPIYMKHDGSLGEEGVEIVTHPGSLAYQLYELRWAEICRIATRHGYKSHDAGTCGLHIHVGRRTFGPDYSTRDDVAGKLVLLAWRLKAELTKFTRRTASQLDRWACFPDLSLYASMDDSVLVARALATRADGRYQAVNLRNDSTVEFRIFRGTLKRDTIAASLQLVGNLVEYARTHTPSECAFTVNFADILAVQQFKELNTYAAKRGLL